MSEIPKAFNRALSATVAGEKYVVLTDGHCGVVRLAPECFAPTDTHDLSRLVAAAIAAPVSPVDRAALLSFALPPCKQCNDSGRRACKTCLGTGRATRTRKECGNGEHECSCPNHCYDGTVACTCLHPTRLGQILHRYYDMRLLRLTLTALPGDTAISIGEATDGSPKGSLLVIRCGEEIGVVMECIPDRRERDCPKFDIEGRAA